MEIDGRGLDEMDKRILLTIAENYKGGPVGLGTVAMAVSEEEHTHQKYMNHSSFKKATSRELPKGGS